jgi:hypothetical protein
VCNILDSDKHKLSVKNDKLETDTSETLESEDVNHRSWQKKKEEAHTETQLLSSPSNKKEDDLKKIKKLKSKRHTEEKTKEQVYKKHDHVKHSSSSRSEHRKSSTKCNKGETGVSIEKKHTGDDSKSHRLHKVKEQSRTKRHGHHSDKKSEKRSNSKTLVKGETHSHTSKSKHKSQGHHHRRHHKNKHTSGKHHQNSKSSNRGSTGIKVTAISKMMKETSADDGGRNAGKLFQLF